MAHIYCWGPRGFKFSTQVAAFFMIIIFMIGRMFAVEAQNLVSGKHWDTSFVPLSGFSKSLFQPMTSNGRVLPLHSHVHSDNNHEREHLRFKEAKPDSAEPHRSQFCSLLTTTPFPTAPILETHLLIEYSQWGHLKFQILLSWKLFEPQHGTLGGKISYLYVCFV